MQVVELKGAIVLICLMQGPDKQRKEQTETYTRAFREALGLRIKSLRLKAGYTAYEFFANDHHISRSQWGRYEKGQDLKYSSLLKVVAAFGMTLSEFFAEGFDKP